MLSSLATGFSRALSYFGAAMCLFVGGVSFVASLPRLFDPTAVVTIDGIPESHVGYRIFMTIVWAAIFAFGLWMLRRLRQEHRHVPGPIRQCPGCEAQIGWRQSFTATRLAPRTCDRCGTRFRRNRQETFRVLWGLNSVAGMIAILSSMATASWLPLAAFAVLTALLVGCESRAAELVHA